jgi:hypothetical protein
VKDRCEDEIPLSWPARQAAGRPKKTAAPAPPRIPRITRLMALAIKFQDMIDRGEVKDYADLARLGYVTRARVTQIMNLLHLAPQIQEGLLCTEAVFPTEHTLRRLATRPEWPTQVQLWRDLVDQLSCCTRNNQRRDGCSAS